MVKTTETISQADLLIDIGPEAGEGGNIIGIGNPNKIKQFSKSATAKYLKLELNIHPVVHGEKSQEIIPQSTQF